jgi:hypothetical protein
MAGMFIVGLLVSFFMRAATVSAGARFGTGIGLSIAAVALVYVRQLRGHILAAKKAQTHEQNISALKAKKNPSAPKGSTESFMGERVLLRPVEGHWMLRSPSSPFDEREASTMSVFNVRVEGFWPESGTPRGILGRDDDQGSGTRGWWVTIVRENGKNINLTKTQRCQAWIQEKQPTGYDKDGTPLHAGEKAIIGFRGLADVVSEVDYHGYDPKNVEL